MHSDVYALANAVSRARVNSSAGAAIDPHADYESRINPGAHGYPNGYCLTGGYSGALPNPDRHSDLDRGTHIDPGPNGYCAALRNPNRRSELDRGAHIDRGPHSYSNG